MQNIVVITKLLLTPSVAPFPNFLTGPLGPPYLRWYLKVFIVMVIRETFAAKANQCDEKNMEEYKAL